MQNEIDDIKSENFNQWAAIVEQGQEILNFKEQLLLDISKLSVRITKGDVFLETNISFVSSLVIAAKANAPSMTFNID